MNNTVHWMHSVSQVSLARSTQDIYSIIICISLKMSMRIPRILVEERDRIAVQEARVNRSTEDPGLLNSDSLPDMSSECP